MKIQRFNTISSLPAVMKIVDYVIPDKKFDKSIVDKSCFTTLDDQLSKLTPMSVSEQEQHFDFVNGVDDGREKPLRKGYDITELGESIKQKQDIVNKIVEKAVLEEQKQAEHKAMQDTVSSSLNTTK